MADPYALFVPVDWIPIVPGATALVRTCRAIRADSDCTVTVKMAHSSDQERVLNFLAGETRYGMFTHITAVSAGTVEGGV